MSQEWIAVDPAHLAEKKREKMEGGAEVILTASPYDVPDGVRANYDPAHKRWVIEFRYLGSEPFKRVQKSAYVTLWIGKHSDRLYGLEIDADRAQAEHQGVQWVNLVVKAIDQQMETRKTPGMPFNYDIAKKVLKEKEPELWQAAAAGK
jgi:hypothetical protein